MNDSRLKQLLILSNPFKEGDVPLGAVDDDKIKAEARKELGAVKIREMRKSPVVGDALSEAIDKSLDPILTESLAHITIANLKRILLSRTALPWIERHRDGLPR